MKTIQATLAIVLLSITCSAGWLFPSKRTKDTASDGESSASVRSSEQLSRMVNGNQPQPSSEMKIGGWGNKVDVTIPPAPPAPVGVEPYREKVTYKANLNASEDDSLVETFSSKTSVPFGVSLILSGIGIIVLVYGIKMARSSSAAVDAAYRTADSLIASQIRSLRERAVLSSDQSVIAQLQSQVAEMEAQRGKLAAQR